MSGKATIKFKHKGQFVQAIGPKFLKLAKQYLAGEIKLSEDNSEITETVDQRTADLAKLRPVLAELIKPDGSAHLSNIARVLGRSTGGGGWEYIKELGTILEEEACKVA